jgi:hypothetical protein
MNLRMKPTKVSEGTTEDLPSLAFWMAAAAFSAAIIVQTTYKILHKQTNKQKINK